MKSRMTLIGVALVLAAAACSSGESDSAEAPVNAGSPDTTVQESPEPTQDAGDDDYSAGDSATDDTTQSTSAPAPSGGASATLKLENGESFTFSILCTLESQEAAGQEILFTFSSYDKPLNLDVTQFGADSFSGAANISVYDADTYDTVWEASTLFGGEVVLELNGNTVTGRGEFFEGDDATGPGIQGELEANC
ncbi:MAG: hypothetical protein ACC654_07755 [Acidimicrobiia bacterium]